MEALIKIQSELNAPKGQFNSFGKYKYRSCEDILAAVKPLLTKYKCTLVLSDDLIMLGDRFYVRATAELKDNQGNMEEAYGFAREAESKKGMDESQITGSASSYARKYALNGLFAIDDTKDADTRSPEENTAKPVLEGRGKNYDKVVAALKNGYTIEQVTAKYEVTEDVMLKLSTDAGI